MSEPFTPIEGKPEVATYMSIADTPRETRLRAQIDRVRAQRDAKERRILVLEQRLRHANYRIIALNEELRRLRDAA